MSEEFNEDEVNEAASCGKKVAKSVLNKIRAKHGMKEEVEDLEELSKETLGRYAHKAKDQLSKAEYLSGVKMGERHMGAKPDSMERKHNQRADKRYRGLDMAIDKLAKEEVEDLEELSTDTLRKYREKARDDAFDADAVDDERRLRKRSFGHNQAGKKIIKRGDTLRAEEAEQIDELSKRTLTSYSDKVRERQAYGHRGYTYDKALKHQKGARLAYDKHFGTAGVVPATGVARVNMGVTAKNEETQGCMIDTSLSDVKQSSKGEVYSKSNEKSTAAAKPTGTKTGVTAGKTGEAYNTTAITKRMPAVENAVLDVMAKSLERRRIYQESTNIAIVSPEQRNDWMNVERGQMDVVSYFNKYKVTEED